MKLTHVSITGADDETSIEELYSLSKEHSLVEWGILYYPEKMGTSRYPTRNWIRRFLQHKPDEVNVALHLCGSTTFDFLRDDLHDVWKWIHDINRVQLNFPNDKFDLNLTLHVLTDPYDIRKVADKIHSYTGGGTLILQANKGNRLLNVCLEDVAHIEYLFDESRGRGRKISDYNLPIETKRNGYAGGISEKNIIVVLSSLKRIIHESIEIWVDMESGVRVDNHFDLNIVKNVLDNVKWWVDTNYPPVLKEADDYVI